jgi:hypothetical protein
MTMVGISNSQELLDAVTSALAELGPSDDYQKVAGVAIEAVAAYFVSTLFQPQELSNENKETPDN